jgi:hypothetical protein
VSPLWLRAMIEFVNVPPSGVPQHTTPEPPVALFSTIVEALTVRPLAVSTSIAVSDWDVLCEIVDVLIVAWPASTSMPAP